MYVFHRPHAAKCTLLLVHMQPNGFRGLWWGANTGGIHLAAGPDWMHLMLEGLGKHLVNFIGETLRDCGG